MSQKLNLTSPVGRIVMGSLYVPNTTDAEGRPLIIKNGPNAGQPRVNFFFALAVPKNGESHWAHTVWGKQIWELGHAAFPGIAASPSFAWKIEDGDSVIPNKKGKRPCDNEGWAGNWIIKLSGGYAPKVYQETSPGAFVVNSQPDFVKPGYFVEANFTVESNNSTQTAGLYLNHSMVCFRGYGAEITFGPDVASAGFGKAPLPAGASAVPLGGTPMPPLPNGAAAAPVPMSAPVAGATPPPPMAYAPPVAAPVPVVPNVGFVQVPPPAGPVVMPPPPSIPAVAVPPPAPPVRQMTAAAGGATYESMIAAGWTDALLVQHGMMLA